MIKKFSFLHGFGTAICVLIALRRPEVSIWVLLLYVAFSVFHYWHRVRLLDLNRLATLAGWIALTFAVYMLPARPKSFALFIVSQLLVFELIAALAQKKADRIRYLGSIKGIQTAFFLSGFSALIYQVAWQRRMIDMLGSNAESVAVIIAIFMAGLGIGSLMADVLMNRVSRFGLRVFCIFEVCIGLFGLISIPLLDYLSKTLANVPQGPELIGFVSLILLPPTILMGATLPVLAEILKPKIPQFNETVGRLYSVNALGSASASLITALVLFGVFGLKAVTAFAAVCNCVTAWMVWTGSKGWRIEIDGVKPTQKEAVQPSEKTYKTFSIAKVSMLALLTGLVTLSQEVLLLKQAAWISGGRPEAFGIGVGLFLLGLAAGSWKQIHTPRQDICINAANQWAISAAAFSLLPFLAPYFVFLFLKGISIYLLIGICGYFGARTLPMITGLIASIDQPKLGRVVAANIVGSVAGALLIGNAMVDFVGLAHSIQLVAALSLVISLLFLWASLSTSVASSEKSWWQSQTKFRLLPTICLAVFGLAASPLLADRWLERMLYEDFNPTEFSFVAESRSGIVAAHFEGGRHVVYGGGVYDGAVNTQLSTDTNGIRRLYRLLGMHDAPTNVLEIGLSSGSWAKVLTMDERIKHIVSVEINPAYQRLVAAFPQVNSVLSDPKLELRIDDGRRWLMANPTTKYDLIVSNTSFYWRAGATAVTSREFMTLASRALKPKGILLMNSTGSPNIVTTALAVFPHVAMIELMVIASNSPLDLDPERAENRLINHPYVGTPAAARRVVDSISPRLVTAAAPNTVVIEDDAMNEEFGNVPMR